MVSATMQAQASQAKQKRVLVTIVVVLALLRFVAVPFVNWQAEQAAELNMLNQQWVRAERLLQQNLDTNAVAQMQESLQTLEASFMQQPANTSDSDFRLQAQAKIQQLVQQYSGQVQLFDWLSRGSTAQGYLTVHQARLIIEGEAANLVQVQLALQEQIAGLQVLEYSINVPRSSRRNNPARLTLLLEVAAVAKGQ